MLTGPQGTRKGTIRGQEKVPGWRGKAEELIKENKHWAENRMDKGPWPEIRERCGGQGMSSR